MPQKLPVEQFIKISESQIQYRNLVPESFWLLPDGSSIDVKSADANSGHEAYALRLMIGSAFIKGLRYKGNEIKPTTVQIEHDLRLRDSDSVAAINEFFSQEPFIKQATYNTTPFELLKDGNFTFLLQKYYNCIRVDVNNRFEGGKAGLVFECYNLTDKLLTRAINTFLDKYLLQKPAEFYNYADMHIEIYDNATGLDINKTLDDFIAGDYKSVNDLLNTQGYK